MSNQLLTVGMVTNSSLPVLENQLKFAKNVVRRYDSEYGKSGAQIGTVLNIRKPPLYVGRTGQGLSTEDAIETIAQLVLTTQFGVDTTFTSEDFTLNIEDFEERFLTPAMARIANQIDSDGLLQYLNVWNSVGTPGTPPSALLTYLQAVQKLNDNAAAMPDRTIIMGQAMVPPIIDALKGLFQSSERIKEQYDSGYMGETIDCKWAMDQNIQSNTIGILGGSPTVNAGGQSGTSLVTNNWTASAAKRLLQGNSFTIGSGATGVFSVNPQSKVAQTSLQNFTATADASSDGSGNMTISINPPIVLSGPFQNVNAAPGAGATINVIGAASTVTPQALCYQKQAFALGMADLIVPKGVDMASRKSSDQLGLSMRYVRAYDINSDRLPGRFDTLYGYVTMYPQVACRIQS